MANRFEKQRAQLLKIAEDLLILFHSVKKNTTGVHNFERLFETALDLFMENKIIFGEDGDRNPSNEELEKYRKICMEFHEIFWNIKELQTNSDIKDQKVLNYIAKYNTDAVRSILKETAPYLAGKKMLISWELTEDEKASKQKFLEEMKKQLVENKWKPVQRFNFVEFLEGVHEEVVLSGNLDDLASYYITYKDRIPDDSLFFAYLTYKVQNQMLIEQIEKTAGSRNMRKKFEPVEYINNIVLSHVNGKYQHQTSNNGCWSCAYAMLLEGYGISLTQEEIRAFRPDMGMGEARERNPKTLEGLMKDDYFSPFELGDLTLKVLPGHALQQAVFVLPPKDNRDNKILVEETRKFIKDKLKNNGAVALRLGGHFRTIVGIREDKLLLKNSSHNKPDDVEETANISDIVGGDNSVFSLTWIHDLKLDKTGKCKNPPTNFKAELKYQGGKLEDYGYGNDPMNLAGITFEKSSNIENMAVQEAIYVPHEVPQAVWKKEKTEVKNEDEIFLLRNEKKVTKSTVEKKKPAEKVKATEPEIKKTDSAVKAAEPTVKTANKKSYAKNADIDMTNRSNRVFVVLTRDVERLCEMNDRAGEKKSKDFESEWLKLTARILHNRYLAGIIEDSDKGSQEKDVAVSKLDDENSVLEMTKRINNIECLKQAANELKKIKSDKPESFTDSLNDIYNQFKDALNVQKDAQKQTEQKTEKKNNEVQVKASF